MTEQESAFEFPCQFPIKAMGVGSDNLDLHVVEIIQRHAVITEGAVKSKSSKGGKYVSITVTITATSRKQLDSIYQDLTDSPRVMVAL